MPTKDDTARFLADSHFTLDQGITQIFRIVEADESNPAKPVKLLEVNPMTIEAGISPVGLGADPSRQVFYASVIIEITPNEFDRLRLGELKLPHGWQIGDELLPPVTSSRTAS